MLVLSLLQTTWWIIDNALLSREIKERLQANYQDDVTQARRALALGLPPRDVAVLYPHLLLETDAGGVHHLRPDPAVIEGLEEERLSRVRRYGWEGTFFLFVLCGGGVVLVRALGQRAELHRRQENFVAAVSHELKSPLASIRLSAETLELRDPGTERRQQLVRRILVDQERLDNLISNLLQTRRLEEGQLELAPIRLDLGAQVAEALRAGIDHWREVGVQVHVDLPEGLSAWADPWAVGIVATNLLDNAGKAVAQTAEPAVWIRGERVGGRVALEVRDNGVGLESGEASKVFEKFYRVGDELRRKSRGTGLGLYLVRKLVTLGGGRVTLASEGPGRGATARATWPGGGSV